MAQPYGAFAKMLLERQHYPDIRPFPGAPAQRPYDVTAHTLPLLLGVDGRDGRRRPFAADLEPVTEVGGRRRARSTGAGAGSPSAIAPATCVALGRLLRARRARALGHRGVRRRRAPLPRRHAARPRVRARRASLALARELGISAQGVAAAPPPRSSLRAPRVGVYQSWMPAMDEGWTRFVFEQQMGVDYQTLHDRDVQAGGLRERFDAIVLPVAVTGRDGDGPRRRAACPTEYTGRPRRRKACRS